MKKRENKREVKTRLRYRCCKSLGNMAGVDIATLGTIIVTSLIAGAVLVVILFIGFKSKQKKSDNSETAKSELEEKQAIIRERKEKTKPTKGKRGNAPLKTHRRQFAILKGHTGDVFDLEFSSNGKYMASTSQGCHNEI